MTIAKAKLRTPFDPFAAPEWDAARHSQKPTLPVAVRVVEGFEPDFRPRRETSASAQSHTRLRAEFQAQLDALASTSEPQVDDYQAFADDEASEATSE